MKASELFETLERIGYTTQVIDDRDGFTESAWIDLVDSQGFRVKVADITELLNKLDKMPFLDIARARMLWGDR